MKLTASDIYTYYRPSKCGLRVTLRQLCIEEAPLGPYEQVLKRLGEEHEKKHLATLPSIVDLSSGTLEKKLSRTKEEIRNQTSAIYHGLLRATIVVGGTEYEILGEPDFLINSN